MRKSAWLVCCGLSFARDWFRAPMESEPPFSRSWMAHPSNLACARGTSPLVLHGNLRFKSTPNSSDWFEAERSRKMSH